MVHVGGRDFLCKIKIRADKLLIKSGLCVEGKIGTERKGRSVTQNRTNDVREPGSGGARTGSPTLHEGQPVSSSKVQSGLGRVG